MSSNPFRPKSDFNPFRPRKLEHPSTVGPSDKRPQFQGSSGRTLPETQSPAMQTLMGIASSRDFWPHTSDRTLGTDGPPEKSTDPYTYYDSKEALEKAYHENPGLREALELTTDTGSRKTLDDRSASKILTVTLDAHRWLDLRKEYLGDAIRPELEELAIPPGAKIEKVYELFSNFDPTKRECQQLIETCKRILELRYKEHPFIPEDTERNIQAMEKAMGPRLRGSVT